ncbi:MAG TPA: Rrf2 family transcriptional regulator [Vicinamibacteria bacterium]|jgi:Rrf2 family protein|nr:Rrf2 family transcriptional regulator [Vicinamibacteria bacterium]
MKMTTQEDYGLRCLLRLGREAKGESLTISELSRQEGIASPTVAKMMRILRRAGLVTSTRGKEGGYTLARSPEAINVGEALAALGGRLFDARFCERHSGTGRLCTHTPDCSIRSVWRVLQDVVDGVLGRMTLKDLLQTEEEVTASVSPRAVLLPLLSRRAL